MNIKKKADSRDNSLKVLSYNVKLFDFDQWNRNVSDNRTQMIDLIKNEKADVICLQEFYKIDYAGYSFNTLDTLLSLLHPVYYHFGCSLHGIRNQGFGLITFSKFKIINEGAVEIKTEGTNYCIYTDILKANDTVRIYNLHLQSLWHKSFKGLYDAFLLRARQADIISGHIKNCKFPVIVCGDFNDTPSSYCYHKIKGALLDSYVENGFGIGSTFAGAIPFQRIDYILCNSDFTCRSFHVIPSRASDHYPIISTLGLHERK